MLNSFSCAFWPFVCLLWRNVCLDLLPIFLIGFFFFFLSFLFWYWAAWTVCMFWRLITCWLLHLPFQLNSTIISWWKIIYRPRGKALGGTKSKETIVDPEFSEHSVDNGKSGNDNWHCYSSTLTWRHSVCIFSFNPYQWQPLTWAFLLSSYQWEHWGS